MAVEILFDEILLEPNLFTVGDSSGSPELANTLGRAPGSGIMKVNITRYDPQHVWNVDLKMMTPSEGSFSNEVDYFNNIWYGGWGSAYGLRVRIENDHIAQGEVLGISDGEIGSRTWKLTRKYNRPGTTTHPYYRYICKPVVSTRLTAGSVTLYEPNGSDLRVIENAFHIYLDHTETTAYTINNTTGVLTLTSTPALGVVVSWSGQFDTPMQFFTNSFNMKNEFPAQITGLAMIEIMPAQLGL